MPSRLHITPAPAPRAPPSRARLVTRAAKKGGGGGGGSKKGTQKKGAGSPADPPKQAKPYLAAPVIMQNLLLIESHFRKTGRCGRRSNQNQDPSRHRPPSYRGPPPPPPPSYHPPSPPATLQAPFH